MSRPPSLLAGLRPMDAVAALYRGDDAELAETILADLSDRVFDGPVVEPAGPAPQFMARLSLRLLQATTRIDHTGPAERTYRNRLLERSGHPYALSLLNSTTEATSNLVEGGDPMNGPYLMLGAGIRANGNRWDRLFFNSVQGRDVQRRFILETRATFEAAHSILRSGRPVRVKAVAAGTGLSMILAYDKLIRSGCDPAGITAVITDRDAANTRKTLHLLGQLPTTRRHLLTPGMAYGITALTQDLFDRAATGDAAGDERFDLVTAVGILEYFEGTVIGTTRERLGLPAPAEGHTDDDLAARLAALTVPGGQVIINTYRSHTCIRILELFGKRFAFRDRPALARLLGRHGFQPVRCAGSGNIYDVEIYVKSSAM